MIVGGAVSLQAQDVHFSQFHLMPLQLNPAMTGFFDGVARIGAIYRNQWFTIGHTKFETYGAYVDGKLLLGKHKEDYLGIGGSFYRDVSGDQAFTTTDGAVSIAYSKGFGYHTKHSIALGIQAEFMMKQFRNGGATFPDGISENIGKTNIGIDATIGLRYHVEFHTRVNMYLGFAYAHVARSKENFTGASTDKLYSKYVATAGAVIAIQDKFNLVPSFMFLMQGPSLEANVGAGAQYVFGNTWDSKNSFTFALNARFARPEGADALIPNLRLDYYGFILGVAYDINISNLIRATNSVGAIEVGAAYIIRPKKRGPHTITYCPSW